MKNKYGKLIVIMVLGLVLTGCDQQPQGNESVTENVPGEVTEELTTQEIEDTVTGFSSFQTVDVNGESVDETLFADSKLTMINVWATYCGPCLNEMPDLGELNSFYETEEMQIVGIVVDTLDAKGAIVQDQVDYAKELITQTEADYIHILPSIDLLTTDLSKVSAVPTTFFVDSEGKIIDDAYIGSRSKSEWKEIVDRLLTEVQD